MEFKNPEVFKIHGDGTVTVSITFDSAEKSDPRVLMKNAAEALKFYADNGYWKSWARRVKIT